MSLLDKLMEARDLTGRQQRRQQQEQNSLLQNALFPADQSQPMTLQDAAQFEELNSLPVNQMLAGSEAMYARNNPQAAGPYDIGTPSPKDFTVESLAQYQETGDPRVLQRYQNPLEQARYDLQVARFQNQQMMQQRPSPTERASLAVQSVNLSELEYLLQDFDEAFVGFGFDVAGNLAEGWRRRFGKSERELDFIDWWTSYRRWSDAVLRAEAGANLTETEAARFQRNQVTPSDSGVVARRKLRSQQQQYMRSLRREQMVMEGYGLDAGEFEPSVQEMTDEELMERLNGADAR